MGWVWYKEVIRLAWNAILAALTNDIWRDKIIKKSSARLREMEQEIEKARGRE